MAQRRKKKEAELPAWPISSTGHAYLGNLRDQLDAQWDRAMKMVATESGVPGGIAVEIGKDGAWHVVAPK